MAGLEGTGFANTFSGGGGAGAGNSCCAGPKKPANLDDFGLAPPLGVEPRPSKASSSRFGSIHILNMSSFFPLSSAASLTGVMGAGAGPDPEVVS